MTTLHGILSENDWMPKKYQDAKLEKREDCKRPYYFIRITVPRPTSTGFVKRRERQMIGFVDEMTKKAAMKRRAEILEAVNAGRIVLQSQIYLRDLVARFRAARLPQFGAGTAARYTSQIDCHILPVFGEKKLCDIDRQMIEAWLASKDKLSWWTREGLRGVMSSIFAAAADWKLWTGDNPAAGVRLGRKKEAREKRLLTAEQLQAILAAVSEDTRFMILIALVAGLRISEVCGLQWRDIDLEAETLTVQRRWYRGDLDEPKSEASRRTRQIGPLAVEFRRKFGAGVGVEVDTHSTRGQSACDLKPASYPQGQIAAVKNSARQHQFIFLGEDGLTPPDERDILRYELRPILKRLKLYYPGFGWHAFRRQSVTWRQTVGGATAMEAMKAAGHTKLDMTMLYSLTDAERERGQVEAIMDKLIGKVEGMKQ